MGRHRRLLPNINSLFLQLHLPSYHQKPHETQRNHTLDDTTHNDHEKATIDAAITIIADIPSSLITSSTTTTATDTSCSSSCHSHSSLEEEIHHHNDDDDADHPHHHKRHHRFSWPSYRHKSRKARQHQHQRNRASQAISLVQQRLEDHHDDHQRLGDEEEEKEQPQHPTTVHVPDMVEDQLNVEQLESNPTMTTIDDHDTDDVHHQRFVTFLNCETRTYTQILGDHPCCLEGCPIQLGWEYNEEISIVDVDEYEKFKLKNHQISRKNESSTRLRLSPDERKDILCKQLQKKYVRDTSSTASTITTSSSSDDDSNTCCCSSSSPLQPPPQQSQLVLERELLRECRRLNRFGRNSSRKHNRKNQRMFFGDIATTAATCTSSRIPTSTLPTITAIASKRTETEEQQEQEQPQNIQVQHQYDGVEEE